MYFQVLKKVLTIITMEKIRENIDFLLLKCLLFFGGNYGNLLSLKKYYVKSLIY